MTEHSCGDREHINAIRWAINVVLKLVIGNQFEDVSEAVDVSKKLTSLTGQVFFVERIKRDDDDPTFPLIPAHYYLVCPLCPSCHEGLQIKAGEVVEDLKISPSAHKEMH